MSTAMRHWIAGIAAAVTLWVARARAQDPVNPHGTSVGACATCHLPESWRPVRVAASFRHAERTFPLDGAHRTTACTACHVSLDFSKVSSTCTSCHKDVHRGELGVNCARCHTTRSFVDEARLARLHEETRFPLRGAHAAAPCESCHTQTAPGQPQFANRPTTCISCHRSDYERATTPPHASAGFPTTCSTCHGEAAWRGAPFDHNATQFPLTGAHRAAACSTCHADGVYQGMPTTCVSCHRADYDKTTGPPHAAAAFSTTCTSCHTTTAWQGASFDHGTTQFPLTGGHRAAACSACHADGVYRGKATACVSCHQPDYDKTITPPHAAAAFPTTCVNCHTTTTWQGAVFDHGTTQFPLTGGHQAVACSACHGDGVYRGKPTTCVTCHRPDYDKAANPPHAAAGYSTDCTTCHTTAAWQSATFDHNATQFPLTGAHRTVACSSCHGDGVYVGKPTSCVSCHRPDYDRVTNPPHAASGFPTDCTTCHTTTTWQGATFDHNATPFPLTGAHLTVACSACHGDGVFQGKPTACVSCHQPDYARAVPPHAASGFSTTCTTCHTTSTWQGAAFDHNTTQFPLTGAHLAVACSACHGDGVYQGKSTACVSCHKPDYDRTTAPSHAAAGFPTTCNTCHTVTTWLNATFDHATTGWPLTGVHASTPCASCHGDGVYQGKPTACASCHQAAYDGTTNPNHKAAAFPLTCESCHTTTTWLGATFDHDTRYFPIYSGSHRGRWTSCTDCHTSSSNYATFTCITCHQQSSTDSNHRGISGYQYQSNACYSCHPRGSGG